MYTPAPFAENRTELLDDLIHQHPLATLIAAGPDGLEATHVPMHLTRDAAGTARLRCHLARANPLTSLVVESPNVLAIFQGEQHYISPNWYPSKQEHGRVVPTWNYVAVHARGRATLFDAEHLLAHLSELTHHNEAAMGLDWQVSDAPADFITALAKTIIGVEIEVESMEGKWKLSQNRSSADRNGVITGLRESHRPAADRMAEAMAERDRHGH